MLLDRGTELGGEESLVDDENGNGLRIDDMEYLVVGNEFTIKQNDNTDPLFSTNIGSSGLAYYCRLSHSGITTCGLHIHN